MPHQVVPARRKRYSPSSPLFDFHIIWKHPALAGTISPTGPSQMTFKSYLVMQKGLWVVAYNQAVSIQNTEKQALKITEP